MGWRGIGGGGPERVTLIHQDTTGDAAVDSILALDSLNTEQCAARAGMLDEIARLDRREVWRADGAASMSQWLSARFGIAHRTAAEWVRSGTS